MGISKYILPPSLYRLRKRNSSIRRQNRVANAWNPFIDDYFQGKIEKYNLKPKKQFGKEEKIIWQYWGQGIHSNSVPELVQICFNSVDKYKGDYRVIRLSDKTIADYVDIPDFVLWKRENNPQFTMTFFSDLLRLILLNVYGGVWLDATVLLTDYLPQEYADLDYFLYQRSEEEKHKKYWLKVDPFYFNWRPDFKVKMLSSIIFAKKSSEVIRCLLDIMLYFWRNSEKLSYYFTLQVIYNEIITRKLPHLQCPIVNDCNPHIIQKKLQKGYPYLSFKEAVHVTSIHKMTYYKKEELEKLKEYLSCL
ncbi:MAG: capsular biosynthesis protein [Bacteroidia bacterium 43-41]|nr:capsular polysaccharide synthesis protein [Petrimonas sp.]OJV36042.1 MAG: capsular biosynthesis protein [Bacteroidia bacterium 43-41]